MSTYCNGYHKKIRKPNEIDKIIEKIKANQTIERKFQKIKATAIRNLKDKLDIQASNKNYEFNVNVNQKKKELNASVQLHHQLLGSYYTNLTQMKPTDRCFSIDGFLMPYLYITLFLSPECTVNPAYGYGFDPDDVRGDLSSSTFTENLSTPSSGFLGDIDVGGITSLPLDISADLSLDNIDLTSGLDVSMSDLGTGLDDVCGLDVGSLDVGSLDVGSLDVGSLDVGSFDVGSFDVGSFDVGSFDVSDSGGGGFGGGGFGGCEF